MKIYLSHQCYKWLVQLKILKAYIIPEEEQLQILTMQKDIKDQPKKLQICYDDQLYLQNGYLVGVLLKQILRGHQLYSQKLLRIRKITVIQKQENWQIVQEVLEFLDYHFRTDILIQQSPSTQDQYGIQTIQKILQFLCDQYGPNSHQRKNKDQRHFHIDPYKLHPLYQKNRNNSHLDGVLPYSFINCNNLLEYTCFILHKVFDYQISIEECLGLLIDKGKLLKLMISRGISSSKSTDNQQNDESRIKSRFHKIEQLYQNILNSMDVFEQLLQHQINHFQYFMQIFAIGTLSQSLNVARLTILLIQSVQNQQWFRTHGIKIIVKSQHAEALNLIIERSRGFFRDVFNNLLQKLFVYQQDFLGFLILFMPVLSKSRYSKEVFQCLPLSYFVEHSTQTFDPDNIETSEPKVRMLCRQVLTIIFRQFFKKMPQIQRTKATIAFESYPLFNLNMSYQQTFSLLANLFQVIKVFLINESSMVQKYFKIAIKYLKAQQHDIKQTVMQNLKQLYLSLIKSFPLGCFLIAYEQSVTKSDQVPIAQSIDFQFLLAISRDQSLIQDQIIKTLNIALQFFMQINGDCFLEIIKNLLRFKESKQWSSDVGEQILNKWTQLKLPLLTSNAYKRKSPQQLCRFEAFGVKRRQILKFQQYQKYKSLLEALCFLKSSDFLRAYWHKVNKKIQQINRDKELSAYNLFLRKLLYKIKLSRQLLPQPIELAAKGLMYTAQGLGINDTITKQLALLNQDQQEVQSIYQESKLYDQSFKKLRNEVNESPINRNGKQNQNIHQERGSILNHMSQSNELGLEQQLNEFLATKKSKAIRQKATSIINQKSQQHEQSVEMPKQYKQYKQQNHRHLQPFGQDQYEKIPGIYQQGLLGLLLLDDQLQQFQITFIKIQRQNCQHLLNVCAEIYIKCMENQDQQIGMVDFLKRLKISKYVPYKQALAGWQRCKKIHLTGAKQKYTQQKPVKSQSTQQIAYSQQQAVWQLLVQYGFMMFGFKRTTRTRVKLISVFLKMLQNTLKQQIRQSEDNYLSINKYKVHTQRIMVRQMIFENKLISNKILNWNRHYMNRCNAKDKLVSNDVVGRRGLNPTSEQMVDLILQRHNQIQGNDNQTKIQVPKKNEPLSLTRSNTLEPWLVCFQIINDTLLSPSLTLSINNFSLGLIQPISKVTTNVIDYQEYSSANYKRKSPKMWQQMNENQLELRFLEQQLEKQAQKIRKLQAQAKKNEVKTKSKINKEYKVNYKRKQKQFSTQFVNQQAADKILSKKSSIHQKNAPPKLQYSTEKKKTLQTIGLTLGTNSDSLTKNSASSFSKLSSSQLKSKIKTRKSQLQLQLKKQKIGKPQNNLNNCKDQGKIKQEQAQIEKTQKREPIQISYNVDSIDKKPE